MIGCMEEPALAAGGQYGGHAYPLRLEVARERLTTGNAGQSAESTAPNSEERSEPQSPNGVGKHSAASASPNDDLTGGGAFTLSALLQDPAATCRAVGTYREAMPARPLNVDLTPETAAAFDDRCRALRLKKKDVVEVLLRGWLTAQAPADLPR